MASNLFTKIDTIFILYNIYIDNEDYYVSHMGIIANFATGFVEGEFV
jgi:hypothetical protein